MRLFRAIVLDAWKTRHANAASLRTTLEAKLADLKSRESTLEDAYVFDKRIDAITYERQRDRLREEIALARLELDDAQLDEIDVEGLLGYSVMPSTSSVTRRRCGKQQWQINVRGCSVLCFRRGSDSETVDLEPP